MAQDKDQKPLNVPPLRFPGFTDEWKKTTLGEIGETMIGLTYSPKDVVENGGTIVFRSSNIQNGMIDYSDLVRVTKPIKERIITKEKDILICARNGSQRLIGKNTLLRESDAGNTFGAFMMVYRSDDNDIIHPLLSTKQYVSQVTENLGARINQITTSDLNSFEFFLPQESEEKRKIGELFALINERIATQNKIIEDLKKLKSAIVDNLMTPQKEWESTKIGNVLSIGSGRDYKHLRDGNIPVYGTGGYMLSVDSYLYDGESVCIGRKGTINKPIFLKGKFWTVDTLFYTHTFCSITPRFCYYLFTTIDWLKYNEASGVPSLSKVTIENISISIPDLVTQKQICAVLDSMTDKLDIEQKLLDAYHAQKQYLLQQIFI